MQANIVGIGAANVNYTEYTSWSLLDAFNTSITNLQTAFNTAPNSTSVQYEAAYQSLLTQIKNLQTIAQNGVATGTGTNTYPTYLNSDMVSSLNDIMGTLSLAGIPPPAGTTLTAAQQQEAIQTWQNLPQYGINITSYFSTALAIYTNSSSFHVGSTNPTTGLADNLLVTAFPTQSLQSALELEYVSEGNKIIGTNLNNLESGLTLTQQILDTLTSAQEFINQITVNPKQPPFAFPPANDAQIPSAAVYLIYNYIETNSNYATANEFLAAYNSEKVSATAYSKAKPGVSLTSALGMLTGAATILAFFVNGSGAGNTDANALATHFQQVYQIAASAWFLQVFPSTDIANVTQAAPGLLNIKSLLLSQINLLTIQTPNSGYNVPGTLANACYKIAEDISTVFKSVNMSNPNPTALQSQLLSSVKTFIIDGMNKPTTSLESTSTQAPIQTDITNALTNATTVEQNQREAVKQYIFVFQQFYQSTASMLQTLEQLFQTISKKIDGQ